MTEDTAEKGKEGNIETNGQFIPAMSSAVKRTRVYKVIVIGDSNVGKTCLTTRYCCGKFPQRTEATIGVDFREKVLDVNGENIKMQLWDTAGQERFRKSMVQHYYRNVHAVVFVYDITKPSSFMGLPQWIEECNKHNMDLEHAPRILIGNKCDNVANKITVSTNVAQKFADRYDMPLFETSAKDDSSANHVEAIFWTLAAKLKNSKPMIRSSSLFGVKESEKNVNNNVVHVGKYQKNTDYESKSCAC
ncbi:Ras-related protein Rab-33B [Nymphon striatum]|nr:Ras-related protein Rab-33B [Nymphon striatum]